MTAAIKSFLVLVLAVPLLIYIGSEIGSEEYLVPLVAGLLLLACLGYSLFFRSQRVECVVLTLLLCGYFVGNRGFAQIAVVQPLFVGEVGMLVIFGAMLFRYAASRELTLAPHTLTWLIACYLAFCVMRLCFDWKAYGIDAPRDAAITYYATFFFAAYQLGRREGTFAFVDRALVWAFSLLAVVALVYNYEPDWLDLITIGGISPLFQKLDITATFCSIGVLFIALRSDLIRSFWLRAPLILLLAYDMMLSGSRAAIVALAGSLALTWLAARRGFVAFPLVLGIFGLAGIFVFGANSSGRLAGMRDQFVSIVDVSGTHVYLTDAGDEKQADNDFRRALWESIFKQTVEDNAWMVGKGFGYNFIPAFESGYQRGSWDTLRSAHNYFITVFGRMGVLGLGLFVAISVGVIQHGLRAAMVLRRRQRHDSQTLAYWCIAWAILISGTFGVVLEGPMGAIPFWSMLGFALAGNDRFELEQKADAAETPEIAPVPRLVPSPVPRPAQAG